MLKIICLTRQYLKYRSNLLTTPMSNRGNQHTKTSFFCRLEVHWLDELAESSKYCRVIWLKIKIYDMVKKHYRQVEILQSKDSWWSVQELHAHFIDHCNLKTEFDQPTVTSWTPFKSGYLTLVCVAHINTYSISVELQYHWVLRILFSCFPHPHPTFHYSLLSSLISVTLTFVWQFPLIALLSFQTVQNAEQSRTNNSSTFKRTTEPFSKH